MNSYTKTRLFIISGPSGSGQDSVIEGLIRRGLPIVRPITTTTRPKRAGEKQGRPYFFIAEKKFQIIQKENKFLEWARVYDHLYGITYEEMDKALKNGNPVFWKVDFKGAKKAKELFPQCVAIFIAPDSLEELKKRLIGRGDGERKFKERLSYSKQYFKHQDLFDYIVYNRDGALPIAVDEVENIIQKHYERTLEKNS